MSDFTTEEGRIEAAKEAGRRVAEFQIADGHTEPQNWDMDGVHNARAFSHLSAAGFTRAGSRLYSQVFVDAYRRVFNDSVKALPSIYWDDFIEDEEHPDQSKPYGDDTVRIIDEGMGGVIAYCHRDTADRIVEALRSAK